MFVFQLYLIGAVGHILYDLAPHLNRFFFGHDRPTSLLGDVQDTPLLHNSHDLKNDNEEASTPSKTLWFMVHPTATAWNTGSGHELLFGRTSFSPWP
jgi:hypothetical protein